MGNIAKYKGIDQSYLDEIEEFAGSGSKGVYLKLEVGKTAVRFLPHPDGKPFLVVHEHYIEFDVQIKGRQGVRFACPRQMSRGKMRCPACEEHDALRRSGNPLDREKSRSYTTSVKYYANVIDRKRPEEGPKIIGMGKQIWEAIREISRDTVNGGDVTNPTSKGFDVLITRTGKGKNDTKYTVTPSRKSSPLGNDEWIASQYNLPLEVGQLYEMDALRALMDGDDPKQALAGGARARQIGSGRAPADEEDDDDVDVDDAPKKPAKKSREVVIDIAPARTAKRRAQDAVLEDADDDIEI